MTTTRLPDTTGEACPAPTGFSQRFFSASGHCSGSAARTKPSRLGPRHCGQSVPIGVCACATNRTTHAAADARLTALAKRMRSAFRREAGQHLLEAGAEDLRDTP